MSEHTKKIKLNISGMHCASCEVLIERKFKDVLGVEKVKVNHATGKAELLCSCYPDIDALKNTVKEDGYTVRLWNEAAQEIAAPPRNTKRDYLEIGAIFLIIVAVYLILKELNLVPDIGITNRMSYGFVFLIGLVAAFSTCMAVTGGLLLAVAAKFNERYPSLSKSERFRPHLYFNIGRVISYTMLGGVVGGIGSAVTLSPRVTGIVMVVVSMVMLILGFQLLHLFPWMKRFQPRMPKFIAHRIHNLADNNKKSTPFVLGALTFFLPCGFTQALQLYVLSQGDIVKGALIMLAFSLGTLPALLSLSAISSFAKGTFHRYFLKFAGVLVVILGVFNVNNGLVLTGTNFPFFNKGTNGSAQAAVDPNVELVNGVQIVNMRVNGLNYSPYKFKVVQGVPVEWRIDGRAAQGCARVIVAPRLGITQYLSPEGITPVRFTPGATGEFPFSCSMGMTTPGAAFVVVENNGVQGSPSPIPQLSPECDPEIMNCVPAQKVSMEVSKERGFSPREFTVKKGIPVEWEIDAKIQLGGCMSTLVIPEYNTAQKIALGKTVVRFTPTKTGIIPFTCSMGAKMGQFTVIN